VPTLLAVDGPAASSSESLPYPAKSAKGWGRSVDSDRKAVLYGAYSASSCEL
jgi:hypothetical protein